MLDLMISNFKDCYNKNNDMEHNRKHIVNYDFHVLSIK